MKLGRILFTILIFYVKKWNCILLKQEPDPDHPRKGCIYQLQLLALTQTCWSSEWIQIDIVILMKSKQFLVMKFWVREFKTLIGLENNRWTFVHQNDCASYPTHHNNVPQWSLCPGQRSTPHTSESRAELNHFEIDHMNHPCPIAKVSGGK